ncbi:MAG: hypothetical protein GXP62_08435, partial [Oligoflexia bacterium]|nr:hypothetical protein [Oligoflexia bacterium]
MKTALRAAWPSVGLHLGLGLLVVGSVLPHPLTRVLGSGDVDVWNHAW